MSEPNQLTIENFLDFLNSQSRELFDSTQQRDDNEEMQEDEERSANTNNERRSSGENEGKDDVSCEFWSTVDTKVLMDRKKTSLCAERLAKNCCRQTSNPVAPFIQEYEEEFPAKEDPLHYLTELVKTQRGELVDYLANYPFSIVLFKRLSILQTVFKCLSKQFHCSKQLRAPKSKGKDLERKKSAAISPEGADVMIQLGVKTGLSLLFALMKQAWMQNTESSEICTDVLDTVSSVVNSLPPLSLANDSKLPKLALTSLDQVMKFLKEVMKGKFQVSTTGRRMCAEILLGLALQRGSLLAALEWVETGFLSCLALHSVQFEKETVDLWLQRLQNSGVGILFCNSGSFRGSRGQKQKENYRELRPFMLLALCPRVPKTAAVLL